MMEFKKRRLTKEELDDRKFRMTVEGERFRERIEREANEAIICPHCGSFDWKMKWVRWMNLNSNTSPTYCIAGLESKVSIPFKEAS